MVGSEPYEEGAGLVLTVGEAAKSRVSDLAKGQGPERLCSWVCLMPASPPDPHCPAEEVGGGQHDLGHQSGRAGGTPGRGISGSSSFSTKTGMCPSPLTHRGLEGLLSWPAVSGANLPPPPARSW